MIVANTSLPNGASGTINAQAGTSGSPGVSGLGELFSLQMGFALQNMQAEEEGALLGQGLSEEEMKALEELMALLQQMLAANDQGNQELEAFIANNGKVIEQLGQKVQVPFPQVGEDLKQLLTKLTQNEPATDEMKQLATLLAKLNGDQAVNDPKRNQQLVRNDALPLKGVGQEDMYKSIQPLRINQGLSAYKAEAGIQSQTVQLSAQSSGLFNQENSEGGNLPQFGGQAPVVAANPAPVAQSFQRAEMPAQHVAANQLPEQVTQIFVKQMNLTQVNGIHTAKLILNPQSLGQVDVTITSNNGVITAHFAAETRAGKEILDNQLVQLRAALSQQGLQVDRLEVTQQQQADSFSFQQQREQAKQQQEQQSEQKQQDDQAEFSLDTLVDESENASQWNRPGDTSREIDDIV
ncbi:flagellar hook-length control protein FliK [Brevibacillus sp. AY1]|uniref:flagellar hook-length control protein FliK n=1 Tax=Brevibacillus sp. AY1 TaxID=2807621 RepID=UPI0024582517|nr:flagellar hook-length control protein FliK [Brevibacillus sp. AY1]MDH4617195.1 flagellar hook-length control protein FliK [Brevibacillus sp. AY1]